MDPVFADPTRLCEYKVVCMFKTFYVHLMSVSYYVFFIVIGMSLDIVCVIFSGWLVDITSGYNSMFYMATALKFCTAVCALVLCLIARLSSSKQCPGE